MLSVKDEIWKPVKDFEGLYEVSNKGRVKALTKKVGNHLRKNEEWELSIRKDSDGYSIITMFKDQKRADRKVHRLVAIAFLINPENKPQVNHKDGNKDNNCVSNLEWNTAKENVIHSYSNNLKFGKKGQSHPRAVFKNSDILLIRKMRDEDGLTHDKIANFFNVNRVTITHVLNGQSYTNV